MEKEILNTLDKDLLLKDLCGRLPYNPLISINGEKYRMEEIRHSLIGIDTYKITVDGCDIEDWDIKPYLFPLSSMTDEQKEEFENKMFALALQSLINNEIDSKEITSFEVDFYHKNHIDWRGLIEKGLAIDATDLNIY